MIDALTVVGCIALAGTGALAAAVALAERDRGLGFAAAVTIGVLFQQVHLLPDATPIGSIPGWVVIAIEAVAVGWLFLRWPAGIADHSVRCSVLGFGTVALLVLPGSYPDQTLLIAVAQLGAALAWSTAVGVRALASATTGAPAPMRPSRRHR